MKPILGSTIRIQVSSITTRKIAVREKFATWTLCRNRRIQRMENDRLIRLRSVGEMFGGVSVKTVRRKIAAHELPQPVYVGRTPMLCLSEVVAVIERLKMQRNQKVDQ